MDKSFLKVSGATVIEIDMDLEDADPEGMGFCDIHILIEHYAIADTDEERIDRVWQWLSIVAKEYFLEPREPEAKEAVKEIVAQEYEELTRKGAQS